MTEHPMSDEEGTNTELAILYAGVKNAFRRAGLATPDLDARILVTETLGVSTAQLIANPRRTVPERLATELRSRTRARLAGQSIGRIIGRRAFWSLDLRVSPHTLEPRPETETVVELALSVLPVDAPSVIADLGVGSGAILLALLSERMSAVGVGVDVSEPALHEAARNAERYNMAARVLLAAGDFGAPLAKAFDLVVSNPPYIATDCIEKLEATVRDYDPIVALDGGSDGLDCYRAVFGQARSMLKPGGHLIVEIDPSALDGVLGQADRTGLTYLGSADDLSGRPRAVALQAPSPGGHRA